MTNVRIIGLTLGAKKSWKLTYIFLFTNHQVQNNILKWNCKKYISDPTG